jgi:hypothetical protein
MIQLTPRAGKLPIVSSSTPCCPPTPTISQTPPVQSRSEITSSQPCPFSASSQTTLFGVLTHRSTHSFSANDMLTTILDAASLCSPAPPPIRPRFPFHLTALKSSGHSLPARHLPRVPLVPASRIPSITPTPRPTLRPGPSARGLPLRSPDFPLSLSLIRALAFSGSLPVSAVVQEEVRRSPLSLAAHRALLSVLRAPAWSR